ncbi:MAG: PqqD family protein [Acidobacteriota bacterium]
MNNSQFPSARKTGLVVQDMPDEVLVYDLDSNKAHCLNKSAAFVWKSCDGTKTVPDIVNLFASEAGEKVSEDFVWVAIDQLSENSLLEASIKADFAGRSRRDVIKKIGMVSVISIPIIASLVAPKNALALASCACINPGDCTVQTGCPSTVNCSSPGVCAP